MGMAIAQFFGTVIAMIYGIDQSAIMEFYANPDSSQTAIAPALRWMIALNQIGGFGISGWIMIRYFDAKNNLINAEIFSDFKTIVITLVIAISLIPIALFISFKPEDLVLPENFDSFIKNAVEQEKLSESMFELLFSNTSIANLVLSVFMFGALPAICEELFFRGFIQKQLQRNLSPALAIVLTGLIFSLFHMQIYGFFSRWILGAAIGYVFYKRKNLIASMLIHFFYNSISVITEFQARRGNFDKDFVDNSLEIPWYAFLFSLVILLISLFFLRAKVPDGKAIE